MAVYFADPYSGAQPATAAPATDRGFTPAPELSGECREARELCQLLLVRR